MPDPKQVLDTATRHGWEATLIAFCVLSAYCGLVWLIRTWLKDAINREERMAKRIDSLEEFQRTTMADSISGMKLALIQLAETLRTKPCLLYRMEDDKTSQLLYNIEHTTPL